MFVLPPPPRYPTQVAYGAAAVNGMPVATIETNNILTHPEGPEHRFQVGEGTYILKNSLHLATPPPHPSEAPIVNPNPLATTPTPPTSGVRLSPCVIQPHKPIPQLYKVDTSGQRPYSIKESDKEDGSAGDGASEGGAGTTSVDGSLPSNSAPAFGEGNAALAPVIGKDKGRRKPKNNIIKSNSSFVSRVIPHESVTKRCNERDPGGIFAFGNINRAYQWLDLSSNIMAEPMAKILFTKAHVMSHDVNNFTKEKTHIDVIMGTSAGDIIWFEPMSMKYARINKNGVINDSPVSKIGWVPGSENLFLAAHYDGHLVVYDKEKEDAAFIPEDGAQQEEKNGTTGEHPKLNVIKSVSSKNQKTNPVALWKICNQRVNSFAFSPDSRHLAVVSEDGCLRVIDYLQEKLLDLYSSYYGGIMCVTWSPDGKYIVTGGQDDLVSIWSLSEHQIVARCQGHRSWVTAVAFDPWRCDERNYRFGSVGEDGKLLLWDFNVGMLHRPKGHTAGKIRGSISSTLQRHRTESTTTSRLRSDSGRTQPYTPESNGDSGADVGVNHAVEPRSTTAQLPPVMSKTVDVDPLYWLGFEEDCIITSCLEGHIKMWYRPTDNATNS